MKITRRQLRRLIQETVYVDDQGVAVDASSDFKGQRSPYKKIVNRLLQNFPEQSEKLSALLNSEDLMNQRMGLDLIESLAMTVSNEEEILKMVEDLRHYLRYFETSESGVVNQPDSEIQYPELAEKWPQIKSEILSFMIEEIRDNFDEMVNNAKRYSTPGTPGYASGWQHRSAIDLIQRLKTKHPKGSSYAKIAKLLGHNLIELASIAIFEPIDVDNDASSLYNQVTEKLYPGWLDRLGWVD